MVRTALGVVGGFLAWMIAWVGGEKIASAISPEGFGAHQRAFEVAVTEGGPFIADTTMLAVHIMLVSVVSILAGFAAARIANSNLRAPLILSFLLLAVGVLKAVMSWPLVPLWYHIAYTGLLVPMTIWGGRLRGPRSS